MEYKLNSEYIELCNLLKVTGYCSSGGEAKMVIQERRVRVDDEIETRKKCKIRKGQEVYYNLKVINVI